MPDPLPPSTPLDYAQRPDRDALPGTLAVTAVALGALSLAFFPFGPVALVLGIVRLVKRQGQTAQGRGFGLVAVVFGSISTAALVIFVLWLSGLAGGPLGRRHP